MAGTIGSFEMIYDSNTDSGICQYRVLPVKKINKNPSGIWDYYGIAQKENTTITESINHSGDRYLCLLCFQQGNVQLYKKSTSSGNMWRHLGRKHAVAIPNSFNTIFKIHNRNKADLYPNTSLSDENTNLDDEEFEFIIDHEDYHEEPITRNIKTSSTTLTDDFKDIGSLLISEIAKHPPLYEFSPNRSPGKREIREKLWSEVHTNLDRILNIKKLKQMWKNIRDRYRKLRNIQKQEHFSTDPTTKYKYYNQLQFLDAELTKCEQLDFDDLTDTSINLIEPPKKKKRTTDLNLLINDDNNMESFIISELQSEEPSIKKHNFEDDTQSIINDINYGLLTENNMSEKCIKDSIICNNNNYKITLPTNTVQKPINSTKLSNNDEPHCIIENNNQYADFQLNESTMTQQTNEHKNYCKVDELELFGRFIAEKLRNNVPKSKWDNLQIKILQLIQAEE